MAYIKHYAQIKIRCNSPTPAAIQGEFKKPDHKIWYNVAAFQYSLHEFRQAIQTRGYHQNETLL